VLGVEGQYVLKIKAGKYDDFLAESDLEEFTIIEEAGNVLPTFDLLCRVRFSDIINYLNEGNVLEVAFGQDRTDMINVRLLVATKEMAKAGASLYTIRLRGITNHPGYLSDSRTRILGPLSGVEAIQQVVGNWFKTDFGVTSSQDSQRWYQTGNTDKQFVNHLWMHSYRPNSFLAVGISCDGTFVLRDVRVRAKQKYDWKLVPYIPSKKEEIPFSGDYEVKSETGFYNQWMGYGRERPLFNLDTGEASTVVPESMSPVLALASTLDRSANVEGNSKDESCFTSENVDTNYHTSFLQNLSNLAVFSSTSMEMSYASTFKKTRVLDLVMVLDRDIQDQNQAAEPQSGLYLISRVTRTFANKTIDTTLRLTRESLSQIKGTFQ